MTFEELMDSTPPMQQHALVKGYQAGFAAGAANRDAEIVSLTNQRDYEYVRAENAEQERDQLREQVTLLQSAIKNLRDVKGRHHSEIAYKRLIEALAATEPKS